MATEKENQFAEIGIGSIQQSLRDPKWLTPWSFVGVATTSQLSLTRRLTRWTYNETLATRKNAYEQEGKSVSYYETKKLLPQWKEEKPELKGVHSQVLQEVIKRVDLAYQAFFRRVKNGEDPGYPRFKGYGRYDSFTYTQTGFSLKPGKLWISRMGDIKIKLRRAIVGEIQRLNIKRMPTGKWFASFFVEVEPDEPLPKTDYQLALTLD